MKKSVLFSVFILFFSLWVVHGNIHMFQSLTGGSTDTEEACKKWVDSVSGSLGLKQKIGQLIMIRTYSNKTPAYYGDIEKIIKEYNIGGLCFFQGGPVTQAQLVNRYQAAARIPVLVAQDAEWGLGMRLDSVYSFPFNMTLGALKNDSLVYAMAAEISRQLNLTGVQMNFAPVVDINVNPSNPVINSRSFGQNVNQVTRLGVAYMKGLQDNGVIATAKHFPGHGDTEHDSHLTLPVIDHTLERLRSVEMMPFAAMIDHDVGAIMTAHLFIPAMDTSAGLPSTLSSHIISDWLTDSLGFNGLRITDALDMKGVTGGFEPGDIELKALIAGNDLLLLPQDAGKAITAIEKAVEEGRIDPLEIDRKCRKLLTTKYECGLHKWKPLRTDSLYEKLNQPVNEVLSRRIFSQAITLVKNENNALPLQRSHNLRIATLSIGSPEINAFQKILGHYFNLDHFNTYSTISSARSKELVRRLSDYDLIIAGFYNTTIFPQRNFGIHPTGIDLVKELAAETNVVLNLFASPYSLALFEPEKYSAIICSYEDKREALEISAQLIAGALPFEGSLPVDAGPAYVTGTGIKTRSLGRLQYSIPEDAGIRSRYLTSADSLALSAIKQKAIPGCQVLLAVDGKIIYNKAFGYHTYERGNFVKTTDLYDLASLTKILGTSLAVMKLSDQKRIDIDQTLVHYLPFLRETDKADIIIREMMAHQAGLKPWIPFYLHLLSEDNRYNDRFLKSQIDENYSLKVVDGLYLHKDYPRMMVDSILASALLEKKEYAYSDLGFYLLKNIIENITNQPFDQYLRNTFYQPLGLQSMTFNPIQNTSLQRIVPTENDRVFRKKLIHGYVHDPGAAMMGGVSGHAGLFSSANDVAVLMQLYLQGGYYGGEQFLNARTVEEFTSRQFPLNENRRGIGFDKPNTDDPEKSPACELASPGSFGHSGFTGTYAWADPEYNMVYVFLSNRVFPDASNKKLITSNIRTRIHEIFYETVIKSKSETNEAVRMNE